jgi:hypothetical protein
MMPGGRQQRRNDSNDSAPTWSRSWLTVSAAVCLGVVALPAQALELVTKDEAALPAGKVPALELRGSPTRRPNIVVVSPPPSAGMIHSPLELKLHFQAFGGAEIDADSVVITYLKQPAIDITQRITPFISASGIDVTQAEVPPGTHQFWIELKDKSGRVGAAQFSFQVAK